MEDPIVGYLTQIQSTIARLAPAQVQQVVDILHEGRLHGRTIFLLGNGGSAATASHWANDLCKGAARPGFRRLKAIALTDNVPLITAWANDTAYENIFAEQLSNFVQTRDVVIGISGSGKSPNVLKAMACARQHGARTIGLTGFDGGRLKDLVDLCIIVPSDSMEQIEDIHLMLSHVISTSLRRKAEVARATEETTEARRWDAGERVTVGPRAVFIDRDGVINQNRSDYVKSWDEFQFLDGTLGALARLAPTALRVVIVSNQSAIGRKRVRREEVEDIHRRMVQRMEGAGGRVDRVLYCPHCPEDDCRCRKPRPGLLEQASRELGIDLARSYLIGDAWEDIEAGIAVGCVTFLVRTGRGRETLAGPDQWNGHRPTVVDDLQEAVEQILERERTSQEVRVDERTVIPVGAPQPTHGT